MAERYVVHPSGEEILMLDGETAKQALARYEAEVAVATDPDTADERAVTLPAAPGSGVPKPGMSSDGPPWLDAALHTGRALLKKGRAFAIERRGVLTNKHFLMVVGGLGLAVLLLVVGTNIVGSVQENVRLTEQQASDEAAAAQTEAAEKAADEKDAAELAVAKDEGRKLLSEAREFETHSEPYATQAQKDQLNLLVERLEDAMKAEKVDRVRVAIGGLERIIQRIGQEDSPAQQAARQAEKDAAAAAQAAADAAAALAAAEEAYVQALIASGRSVDATNRPAVLKSARDFCQGLIDSPDQSLTILVPKVRSSNNSLPATQAVATFCPQYNGVAGVAAASFGDGSYVVGSAISEGTYATLATGIKDCYWERSDGGGNIIDNDFITFAPNGVAVTVYTGEGFTVSGCGLWAPQ